ASLAAVDGLAVVGGPVGRRGTDRPGQRGRGRDRARRPDPGPEPEHTGRVGVVDPGRPGPSDPVGPGRGAVVALGVASDPWPGRGDRGGGLRRPGGAGGRRTWTARTPPADGFLQHDGGRGP